MTSDFYCPLPFKHVFVEPRGVKPCCSYTHAYTGSIANWIASDELQQIQTETLAGTVPEGCRQCVQNEQTHGTGTRIGAIKDYGAERRTTTTIDYIDYRSSNVCNFKCRSCEPYFSNGIAQELRNHIKLQLYHNGVPDNKVAPTTVEDYEWIISNIHTIDRLMFTGGEPTMIPEVRKIIDHIREHRLHDIVVMITTNASFTDPYWLEITQELPRIHWTLSLDAIGPAAEIIRHGTRWPTVFKNIETMFDLAPSVNIGTIITNQNVMQLKSLFGFVNRMEQKYQHRANGRTQFIEICSWPEHMSPYNWPDELRPTVLEYLKSIDCSDLQDKQQQIVNTLIDNIENAKFKPLLWRQGQDYNQLLDDIRSENHLVLYQPDL
jgi:sulfatase maturation enzyme AslB (radical SAM superfamily)